MIQHCIGMRDIKSTEMIRYMLVRLKPIWPDAHVIAQNEVYSPRAWYFPKEGMICSLTEYEAIKDPVAVHFVCADTIQLTCPAQIPAWDLLRGLGV